MIVADLIKELEELPPELPVVTDYREIKRVREEDSFYFLDSVTKTGYTTGPAVVLE